MLALSSAAAAHLACVVILVILQCLLKLAVVLATGIAIRQCVICLCASKRIMQV
jgi:hypothetical protein